MLVLSGGVSMGQFDFVPSVLTELGAKLVLHKVEQRPGRPMWFGVSARGKPIFALPGNPVSTLVCATRYVLPALRQASGLAAAPPELVEITAPIEASPTLTLVHARDAVVVGARRAPRRAASARTPPATS